MKFKTKTKGRARVLLIIAKGRKRYPVVMTIATRGMAAKLRINAENVTRLKAKAMMGITPS